jgi:uncharacterized SAM-binding protein YcdF (DUF218 family)
MYALFTALIRPYTLLFVLIGLGIAWLWYRRRESRLRLLPVSLAFLAFWVLSLPLTAHVVSTTFERGYTRLERRPADTEAIVVLSGSLIVIDDEHAELGASSLYRCLHGAALYRAGAPCPVVVTGGKVDPRTPGPSAARVMADFLQSQGVRAEDLVIEGGSSTTYENALKSVRELKTRGLSRIVLVTDANHMPRAVRCFRKQGCDLVPSVCDAPVARYQFDLTQLLPSPNAARVIQETFHELLGLAWYVMLGRA